MYEGDNLQMLECKIPSSGKKIYIDFLNMVIEMLVASFVMCKKLFDLMSFQKPHRAGPSIALVFQVSAFSFYIFVTEKHVFYSLGKKKENRQGLFFRQSAEGFTCQTPTSLNELPA